MLFFLLEYMFYFNHLLVSSVADTSLSPGVRGAEGGSSPNPIQLQNGVAPSPVSPPAMSSVPPSPLSNAGATGSNANGAAAAASPAADGVCGAAPNYASQQASSQTPPTQAQAQAQAQAQLQQAQDPLPPG